MARDVYSFRFIQAHGLTGTVAYTVPDDYIAVVRDVDSYIGSPLGLNNLYLHGALGQTIWWTTATIGESMYASFRGRQVYEPGEEIELEADVGLTDAYDVTVSGYLLTLT